MLKKEDDVNGNQKCVYITTTPDILHRVMEWKSHV